ncbi:tetratricopeptide repeat protein 12 [Drosophila busckii]|uniref:tetratricopeptide repeat protein 12 n=1 Tax=Drosophila busckii TaxID=30019 RepID=UPI00083F2C60|nr:tetratricopeptide repeat protein 12 [Drosophila busckii]
MHEHQHEQLHEDFLAQPSKVNDLMKFISDIANANKMEGDDKKKEAKAEVDISAGVTDTSFMVMKRYVSNSKRSRNSSKRTAVKSNMNQMTFMRQIESTQEEREKTRIERMRIANNYRRLGNCEYRRTMYDKAIEFYSRGLDYITDTPVLFCNRALCYIKKRDFKRALMDLEHVLNDLDQKCLRAWLYKAGALKRLNNEAGFEECIDNARRFNRANLAYVDVFLEKMRSDF